jgi:hypothetical protein
MGTRQVWKLTGTLGITDITMTVVWDAARKTGVVYNYGVVASDFVFKGWAGWIRMIAGQIVYWVGGYVPSTYYPDQYLLNAFVKGSHEGVWTPTDPQAPFVAATSIFDFQEDWRYYTNP